MPRPLGARERRRGRRASWCGFWRTQGPGPVALHVIEALARELAEGGIRPPPDVLPEVIDADYEVREAGTLPAITPSTLADSAAFAMFGALGGPLLRGIFRRALAPGSTSADAPTQRTRGSAPSDARPRMAAIRRKSKGRKRLRKRKS